MADITASVVAWSDTESSNSPSGTTTIGTGLDDNLRAIQSAMAKEEGQGSSIASAGTTAIGASGTYGYVHVTGTTTITSFGTIRAGVKRWVIFDGVLTLTYNATSMILPKAVNITTAAGDMGLFVSEGSGNWRCLAYYNISQAEVSLASSGTTDLGTVYTDNILVTGTTTITSFGTVAAGTRKFVRFNGSLTLTYNATSMILPGGASITTAANDNLIAESLGSGNWIVTNYTKADGTQLLSFTYAPVRQTVLTGAVDSNGYASHLSAGAGLNFNISATSTPLQITYASGFSQGSNVDRFTTISADASNQGSLAASNTNFITSTYATATTTTWGSTLAPPQYGIAYDRTKQALLHFEGTNGSTTILDDYGNTWSVGGNAQIATAQFKFGASSVAFDGTTDYIETTGITSLPNGSWTTEFWLRFNALPGVSTNTVLWINPNAGGFGVGVGMNTTAGSVRTLIFSASSNGTSMDIANATNGANTTWATGTWYQIVVTFDALAGKYFVYKDGVSDISVTSSARVSAGARQRLGSSTGLTNFFATPADLNGWIDEFSISPYCRYPNGTTFTPPSAAYSVSTAGFSSDFFDTSGYKMYGVTAASGSAGVNPTLTAKNVVYHGEADTGASTVSAVRNYAYQGKYVSQDTTFPGASTRQAFSANIGTLLQVGRLYFRNYTAEGTYVAGNVVDNPYNQVGANNFPAQFTVEDRVTASIVQGSNGFGFVQRTNGSTQITPSSANWKIFAVIQRAF